VIVDAANTLYRAFFALPPLRSSRGEPTHAALGFVNMLNKVIREEQPDYLVVVFDAPGKGFREELYPEYKAHRDALPEDLESQFELARAIAAAQRIAVLEVPGVEADDVIATLATRVAPELRVTVVSTDKDLMQLVDGRVELLDTMKDRRYGPAEVEERFGVPPPRVLDVRALAGDPSDNIPGVKGIGEKGAAQLIREFGSLEALLEHSDQVKARRAREALQQHAEEARLSKRLATLECDVPLELQLADLERREPDVALLRELYRRLEFGRLLEALGPEASAPREGGEVDAEFVTAPAGRAAELRGALSVETRLVNDLDGLRAVVSELEALPELALELVCSRPGSVDAEPVGLAVALDAARAAYLPIGRRRLDAPPGLELAAVLDAVAPLLAGPPARRWLSRDTKRIQAAFAEAGHELAPPGFETELAAFLVDPSAMRGSVALARSWLGRRHRGWEELAGRGARAQSAGELPVEAVATWAGAEACLARALVAPLAERLERDGLRELFERVELPLTGVLARMERAGVRVDERVLAELSQGYERELQRIEGEIWALAGERFQIASPKQLQRILFEKLKLPVSRRTKTGYSTDEGVLEQLAAQHELPARILAHRRLAKLKSTYVDALPPLVNPRTGRIHPTFHQTGAATGRLSASDPNVQNIPIRSEEGVRIREAFVPAEGARLLSADYSQVELRILAHYSGDESLIQAFAGGEDVHRRTAAEVLGLAPEAVTPEQRARAKAVNFGIIYGSSAFGLANQLGIATGEAQDYIQRYFARYGGVRRFLDETVERATREGFVRTLLGRRRYLPDLRSRNRVLKGAAERMAVNTVIQGTAADLIKKAMVDVDAALRREGLQARMILQVHDELVLEAPLPEVERVGTLVRECMQAVWPLRVPLVVDLGMGRSWREAH
jgi:DNA polymerase-1